MTRRTRAVIAAASILVVGGCHSRVAHVPQPQSHDGRFRVGVWNVAESSFVRRPEAVRRVLQAADADVFSFDEVGEHTSPDQLLGTLRGLRGPADTTWHLSWGVGGDYQRTVIAARVPLEPVPEFAPLRFPDDAALVLRKAPDSLHARL